MTSRVDNAWHKMGRASQHTDELEASIVAFHQTNPYQVVVEDDPQTGKRTPSSAAPCLRSPQRCR